MTITFVRRSAYCLAVILLTLLGIALFTRTEDILQLTLLVGGGLLALAVPFLVSSLNQKADGASAEKSDASGAASIAAQMDIANMIVHDLRSPLNSLNVSMDLLREMAHEPTLSGAMVQQTTALAQRALRKLLNLVNSLLDLAKLESGTMVLDLETVALHPIVDQVIAELTPIANEMAVAVVVEMPLTLPFVRIDSDQIERVLSNLVENGIKFAPPETGIIIRVRAQPDSLLRVEVIDQGMGVPDAQKTRIFDRYFQGDQTHVMRRGTGLGLTFCQLAIQAHGGAIWVEDNLPPATGSVFIFTLPTATHEAD